MGRTMKYFSIAYFKHVRLLVAFIVVPAVIAIAALFHHTCSWFYWAGYILQCPSILGAVIGFRSSAKIIGRTKLWTLFLRALRPPPPIEGKFVGTAGGRGGAMGYSDPGKLFIEQRVEILEKTTIALANRIGESSDKHEELKSAIDHEGRVRSAEDERIISDLKAALLDGLPIAAVSIIWLIVGIGMSAWGGFSGCEGSVPVQGARPT